MKFRLLLVSALLSTGLSAATIAYTVDASQAGTQGYTGSLGMDFTVNSPIQVTALGVFDSLANGIVNPNGLSVAIFSISTQTIIGPTMQVTGMGGSFVVGASRFVDTTPFNLVLTAGDYSVVSWGYSSTDLNGNTPAPSTTDNGGGLITFIGGGRFGATAGAFPTMIDGGPVNRYQAGTFEFQAAIPEPSTFALLGLGLVMLGAGRRRMLR